MMKKKKGYRNGGKIKGMMMGGRMKAKMTLAQLRAAANKMGMKLVKKA